jgi:sialic acid synthase SpsE
VRQSINLAGRIIGQGARPFVIAELGTGHAVDLNKAYKLIQAAGEAGADAVKVQIVFADEIVHPLSGQVMLPGGAVPLYNRFKEYEKDFAYYANIKDYTEKSGLVFLCSVFGSKSLAIAKKLDIRLLKIASPELNHYPLLRQVAEWGIPTLLSTGVSRLSDIERALEIIKQEAILLQCVTSYPAPEAEYNLKVLPALCSLFGIPVGISDHSLHPVLVPVLAVAFSACVIEKHFTILKSGLGLDDAFALEKDEFAQMVKAVRKAESLSPEKILAWLKKEYGKERVKSILGDGIKRLAPSEANNYYSTRRSILALKNIKKGEIFSEANIALLRSEKNLRSGLSPEFLPVIYGKKARQNLEAGKGVSWDDIV